MSNRVQGALYVSAGAVIVLIALNNISAHLGADVNAIGDLATDMLLTRKISEDGYLLTGHYSRFGFNHPGPFFFYLNFAFENLAIACGGTRYGAWVLSATFLNVFFLLLSAWLMSRAVCRKRLFFALAATIPIIPAMGYGMYETWMPYRILLPFLSYLCTLLLLLQGNLKYMPLAAILVGILIHGYVTQPIFTLGPLALALSIYFWKKRRIDRSDVRTLLISFCIGLLFASPLLIDSILNGSSNVDRIISALKNGHSNVSFLEPLQLIGKYWSSHWMLSVVAAATWLTVSLALKTSFLTENVRWGFLVSVLLTCLFYVYHVTAPKPLHEFIGLYYVAGIYFMAVIFFANVIDAIPKYNVALAISIIICTASLFLFAGLQYQRPASNDFIGELSSSVIHSGVAEPYRLDYPLQNDDYFRTITGMILHLRNKGYNACIARPELDFMYTRNAVCDSQDANISLQYADTCGDGCIKVIGNMGVFMAGEAASGIEMDMQACRLPARGRVDSTACAVSGASAGVLTFGPYIKLAPGRYYFSMRYSANAPASVASGHWDVATDTGRTILATGNLPGTEAKVEVIRREFIVERFGIYEVRSFNSGAGPMTMYDLIIGRRRDSDVY